MQGRYYPPSEPPASGIPATEVNRLITPLLHLFHSVFYKGYAEKYSWLKRVVHLIAFHFMQQKKPINTDFLKWSIRDLNP